MKKQNNIKKPTKKGNYFQTLFMYHKKKKKKANGVS